MNDDGVEFAWGEYLAQNLAGEFRCVTEGGRAEWYRYTQGRWQVDSLGAVREAAKRHARSFGEYAQAHPGVVAGLGAFQVAARVKSHRGLAQGLYYAQSAEGIATAWSQFDANPALFVAANATLDVTTGEWRPPRPDDLSLRHSSVEYVPGATAPAFEGFLDETFEDAEVIAYLQRFFGYCLGGFADEQVFPIFWGGGANGKSTLVKVIAEVLGSYAQSLPSDFLLKRRQGAASNDLAQLKGARLGVGSELPRGGDFDVSLIKRLTGGDAIRARALYREFEEYRPTAKFIAVTNDRPQLRADDDAIWRRMHLIPFVRVVDKARQDTQLASRLLQEASGILNWLAEGAAEYRRVRLNPPPVVLAATSEYRAASDSAERFVQDVCVVGTGSAAAADTIAEYHRWCSEEGLKPLSPSLLRAQLERRGVTIRRTAGGIRYEGLSVVAAVRVVQPVG